MQLINLTTILAIGVSLAMGHVLPSIQDEAPSDKGDDFSTMDERLAPSMDKCFGVGHYCKESIQCCTGRCLGVKTGDIDLRVCKK